MNFTLLLDVTRSTDSAGCKLTTRPFGAGNTLGTDKHPDNNEYQTTLGATFERAAISFFSSLHLPR